MYTSPPLPPQLSIPIEEFENKKYFKCVYINVRLREEVGVTVLCGTVSTNWCSVCLYRRSSTSMWIRMAQSGTCCKRLLMRLACTPFPPVSALSTHNFIIFFLFFPSLPFSLPSLVPSPPPPPPPPPPLFLLSSSRFYRSPSVKTVHRC